MQTVILDITYWGRMSYGGGVLFGASHWATTIYEADLILTFPTFVAAVFAPPVPLRGAGHLFADAFHIGKLIFQN